MLSKIPYSKEYEKSILNDSIEDSLKNIPPDTYEHFFLLLNEEFKKSYSSKTLTDEFKKLLKFTEQNKKFYHLYEIFSNKSKYIEFDFPNTTPQRKEEIIQSFKVSVPKPTKPEFIKKDSHYGSTSTKDTSPSVLGDALFNKLILSKAKQRSFKESLAFKTPKELAETLTAMLSNITEQNTKHLFTLASYFKQYYLLSLETFTTFIKFLNDKLKQPSTQNQPRFDIYFDFSQLTLVQLEFIIKEANNYEIIKDKNAAINEYIQKKYQSRLDALKDNPLAQRNIIYEIYTDKKTLSPYQNYSSNLLIQILTLDIKLNNMNLDIFLQYLQNPTNNNSYETQTMFNKNIQKQLLSNNSLFTLNNVNISMDSFHDNTLIKEYLHYFFYNKLATVETFNKYLEEKFLQKQYFIASVLRGDDIKYDQQLHGSFISKEEYETLCKKIEITICKYNKTLFEINEDVVIDLDIKNVSNMSVSIYEINTENYYLQKKQPLTSLIVVEGLITSLEEKFEFNYKSEVLVKKQIKLDKIPKERGVYLIEILGNGISSRIIIKKGSLNLITRSTSKGILCYIVNEKNEICKSKNTYIIYKGNKYHCEQEKGIILLPYKILQHNCNNCILSYDNFSEFAYINIEKEVYTFKGEFYMNHESFVTGNLVKVLFKPMLYINKRKVPLSLIEKGKITINMSQSENGSTIPVYNTIENVSFNKNNINEFEFEVRIPSKIQSLEFIFEGEVMNNSTKQPERLYYNQIEQINTSDWNIMEKPFLRKVIKDNKPCYIIDVYGKNGEKKVAYQCNITLYMYNNETINAKMQSDNNGQIILGDLQSRNIKSIVIPSLNKKFPIENDTVYSYPTSIDIVPGEVITLPLYTHKENDIQNNIMLLQHKDKSIIHKMNIDAFIKVTNNQILNNALHYFTIEISKLPVGYYDLYLNDEIISITVHNGMKWTDDFILSNNTKLIENSQPKHPIYLSNLQYDTDRQVLKFKTNSTQINQNAHIMFYQFLPFSAHYYSYKIEDMLFKNVELNSEHSFQQWNNIYLSNRILNEEIQYVLKRKKYEPIMGNSLIMPSLLVKRDFTKQSSTDEEKINKGTKYEKKDAQGQQGKIGYDTYKNKQDMLLEYQMVYSDFHNFIGNLPILSYNIEPINDNGEYEVKLPNNAVFSNYSYLQIILEDNKSISSNILSLANDTTQVSTIPTVNQNILDNTKMYTEIRKCELHYTNKQFAISETADYKIVDSIDKLVKFFLVQSPEFRHEWKDVEFLLNSVDNFDLFKEKYSEFISHEVNVFIYFKYPELFDKVVKPMIKYKFEKTFIDYFLLDDIETLKMYLQPQKIFNLNTFELCLLMLKIVNIDIQSATNIRNVIKSRVKSENVENEILKGIDVIMNMERGKDNEDKCVEMIKDGAMMDYAVEQQDECLEECTDTAIEKECAQDDFVQDKMMFQSKSIFRATGFRGRRDGAHLNQVREGCAKPLMNAQPIPVPTMLKCARPPQQAPMPLMTQCCFASNSINSFNSFQNTNHFGNVPNNINYSFSNNAIMEGNAFVPGKSVFAQNIEQTQAYDKAYELAQAQMKIYEQPESTKEYQERHFLFKSSNDKHNLTSMLYLDFADHILTNKTHKNFISKHMLCKQVSIGDIIWQLSIIDIPVHSVKHIYNRTKSRKVEITPNSNLYLFIKVIEEGKPDLNDKVLISQNITSSNYNIDSIEPSFLAKNIKYNHETIITNISNQNIQLDLFIEIPEGSIPLDDSYYTQLYHLNINSFTTTSFSVQFYFPNEGSFNMYHPIAAKGTTILSVGQPLKFTVNEAIDYNKLQQLKNEENLLKEELYDEKKIYNSNKLKDVLTAGGSDEEIISFFKNEAFTENDVELVLWLVYSTESFYNELIKILRGKGMYCHNLWVYGFKYKDVETIREYLSNNEDMFHCKELLGPNFESSLVVSNETDYEKIASHLEYMNLVNARAHPLGKRETNIMNNEFNEQYQKFIIQTIQSLEITLRTKLRLVYYLILQERFNEAKVQFDKITKDEVNEYKKKGNRSFEIQYDYLSAYLDFCFGYPNFDVAKSVCTKYKDFPLKEWKEKFEEIEDQLLEYEEKETVTYEELEKETHKLSTLNNKEYQKQLLLSQPTIDFTIENKELHIIHSNINKIIIKFYLIDLEILFTRNPSIKSSTSNDFCFVEPNFFKEIIIDKNNSKIGEQIKTTFMIPESFTNKNIFIEINGDNIKTFDTYFSANLQVKLNESFGEIKVTNTQFKPIIKAYVKCHALIDDTVMFYKDGYTDLRGTFNYLSLNTDQIYKVKKFYLFVSDEKMGALVKEVNPPSNMINKKGGDYYESLQEYKQQRKDEWRALNKKRPAGS